MISEASPQDVRFFGNHQEQKCLKTVKTTVHFVKACGDLGPWTSWTNAMKFNL